MRRLYRLILLLAGCGGTQRPVDGVSNSQPTPTTARPCGERSTLWVDIPDAWEAAKDLANIMHPRWPANQIGKASVSAIRARIAGDVKGYIAVFRREVLDAPLSAHAIAVWRAANVANEIASVSTQLGGRLRTDTLLLLEHARSCVNDVADGAALDEQIRAAKLEWLTVQP